MKTINLRFAAVGLGAALVAGGITGCGSSEPEDYQPASYGNGSTDECYYIEDPDEVVSLKDAGLCENDWTPRQVTADDDDNDFFFLYMPYLSSPAYYDRHVPSSKRSTYKTKTAGYTKTYASQIKSAAPKAEYRNSAGTSVKGDKVAPTRFGGGSRNSGGGGSRNCSMGSPQTLDGVEIDLVAKPGGSFGGGSRSSGGGGSRPSAPKSNSGGQKSSGGQKTTTKTGGC